jgi:hypothetical protein
MAALPFLAFDKEAGPAKEENPPGEKYPQTNANDVEKDVRDRSLPAGDERLIKLIQAGHSDG